MFIGKLQCILISAVTRPEFQCFLISAVTRPELQCFLISSVTRPELQCFLISGVTRPELQCILISGVTRPELQCILISAGGHILYTQLIVVVPQEYSHNSAIHTTLIPPIGTLKITMDCAVCTRGWGISSA